MSARPARLLALLALLAVVPADTASAAGPRGIACAGRRPTHLAFERSVGAPSGRLSWRAPPRARRQARYRVYRNREVIRQTRGRSARVRVSAGRRYVFRVRPVTRRGALLPCDARLWRAIAFVPPGRVEGLVIADVTDAGASLSWLPAVAGDAPVGGYRLFRDGEPIGQDARTHADVELPSQSTASYRVAAVDTRGNAGARSAPATVVTGHLAPGAPAGLRASVTDTSVTLSWRPGATRSRPIAGYRIYRDGTPVRQVPSTAASVGGLAPATSYQFAVAAVDSLGYESDRSAPVTAKTAVPPPTQGSLHAFLLASTDMSFRDLQDHYRQIGTVYPTYYQCEADGTISGNDDPLVSRWSLLRRIAVLDRVNCQSPTRLHLILTDPVARAATLERLAKIAAANGHDGLNLDFETGLATDRNALTSFVAELAAQLHAQGRKLSVEVSAKTQETFTGRSGFYDYAALAQHADTVFVMNWGKHWTTSTPGAIADLPWATQVADYVATMPNRSRFVLGTAMYGIDWPNGGGPSNPGTPLEHSAVMALAARVGAVPEFDPVAYAPHFSYVDSDGVPHEVWYSDAPTISVQLKLAADRGLAMGVWRLGSEDQAVWADPLLAP